MGSFIIGLLVQKDRIRLTLESSPARVNYADRGPIDHPRYPGLPGYAVSTRLSKRSDGVDDMSEVIECHIPEGEYGDKGGGGKHDVDDDALDAGHDVISSSRAVVSGALNEIPSAPEGFASSPKKC